MPLASGVGVAAFHLQMEGDSEDMVTTLGVLAGEGFELDEAAADRLNAVFHDELLPELSDSMSLVGVELAVGTEDGDAGFSSAGLGGTGTSGQCHPPNCAVLFQKRTASGGRKNRGRMFIPGIKAGSTNAAGLITGGALTSLQAAATAFMDALGDPPGAEPVITPVILHGDDSEPTIITSLRVSTKIATQRRRLRP